MGLFSRKTTPEQEAPRAEEFDELVTRVMQLEGQLADLEKPVRDLEMEWQDWFEKFRNLYARITRRIERAEKTETTEANGEDPVNPLAMRLLHGRKVQ